MEEAKPVSDRTPTTIAKRIPKTRRGIVVISEHFHAIAISNGLYSYDILVDKKISPRNHKPGAWFPERDQHLDSVIESMQKHFFNSAGEPTVTEILIGGPDETRLILRRRLPPKLAQLAGQMYVVGKPTKKSIALRLNDILIRLEEKIVKQGL